MKTQKHKKLFSISHGARNKKLAPQPLILLPRILYEDKDLAVFDKPAGVAVSHDNNSVKVAFDPTKFIVHRLDKDTSGVLITAKNLASQKYLSKQFMERETDKHYIAFVCGHLAPAQGRIEAGIGRSAVDRKKMSIFSSKLRQAVTHYSVVRYFEPYTLLDIKLETGRTHQIRVHLQSIGFPIVGDPVYGNKRVNAEFREFYGLDRQFLHSHKIGFKLLNGKRKIVESKLPEDLNKVLKALGN